MSLIYDYQGWPARDIAGGRTLYLVKQLFNWKVAIGNKGEDGHDDDY